VRDEFEIRSAHEGSYLRFSHAERRAAGGGFDYCRIELAGAAFSGRLRAYDTNWAGVAAFFQDLADNWRGSPGVKNWGSLEGQVELRATFDSLGHTSLRIFLREDPLVQDWRVEATLVVEAGQLQALTKAALEFFGGASAV
jgi:hypothetical protein